MLKSVGDSVGGLGALTTWEKADFSPETEEEEGGGDICWGW